MSRVQVTEVPRVVDAPVARAADRAPAILGGIAGVYLAVVLLAFRDLPRVLPTGTTAERAAMATVRLVGAPMTLPGLDDVNFLVAGLFGGAVAGAAWARRRALTGQR